MVRRWLRQFGISGVAALLLSLAHPAQARWREATTAHFTIYSDGSADELREFSVNLERFDTVLRRLVISNDTNLPMRVTVYLMPSQAGISNLFDPPRSGVAGFYRTTLWGPVAFAPRTDAQNVFDVDGITVLFHEYAHHFMLQSSANYYPRWFTEGFAEFLSTMTFSKSKGVASIGKAVPFRIPSLANNSWIPMERLLLFDAQKAKDIRSGDVEQLYAQGWLLTHYLFNTKARQGQLFRYFQNLNAQMASDAAFADAFKTTYAELGAELRRYYNMGRLPYQEMTDIRSDEAGISIRTLSEAESDALMPVAKLRLGVKTENEAAFVRKFNSAIAAVADSVSGRLALAELALGQKQPDGVPALLAPVLDAPAPASPDYVRALALMATQSLMQAERASPENRAAAFKLARSWAVKANRAAPETPLPLVRYYQSFQAEPGGPTAVAVDGLVKAADLLPQDYRLALFTAGALIKAGNPKLAKAILAPVASAPHDAKRATAARAMLAAIDSGSTSPVAPDASQIND